MRKLTLTWEREPRTCGNGMSLMLDWNFFIISAIETNGAAGSRIDIYVVYRETTSYPSSSILDKFHFYQRIQIFIFIFKNHDTIIIEYFLNYPWKNKAILKLLNDIKLLRMSLKITKKKKLKIIVLYRILSRTNILSNRQSVT